jgi:hypothetical protein
MFFPVFILAYLIFQAENRNTLTIQAKRFFGDENCMVSPDYI